MEAVAALAAGLGEREDLDRLAEARGGDRALELGLGLGVEAGAVAGQRGLRRSRRAGSGEMVSVMMVPGAIRGRHYPPESKVLRKIAPERTAGEEIRTKPSTWWRVKGKRRRVKSWRECACATAPSREVYFEIYLSNKVKIR